MRYCDCRQFKWKLNLFAQTYHCGRPFCARTPQVLLLQVSNDFSVPLFCSCRLALIAKVFLYSICFFSSFGSILHNNRRVFVSPSLFHLPARIVYIGLLVFILYHFCTVSTTTSSDSCSYVPSLLFTAQTRINSSQ